MFIAALFTIAKKWKQPLCPLPEEWIKKMWFVTTGCYLALGKEILPFATTGMNLEDTVLTEISQSQKDRYCMIPLI